MSEPLDTSEFDKTCALCGEEGWQANPLRRRVALNGERMLAHTPCWLGEDWGDATYGGDPSPEWDRARAMFAAAASGASPSPEGAAGGSER